MPIKHTNTYTNGRTEAIYTVSYDIQLLLMGDVVLKCTGNRPLLSPTLLSRLGSGEVLA